MNRAQFLGLQNQVRILATSIGLRAAARACNLAESRVLQWSSRGNWGVSAVHPVGFRQPTVSSEVISPIEAVGNIVQHYGDRAKIGAVIAGSKALEHLADTKDAKELVKPANAISADQWTKAVDRAAGWTQARAAGVNVGVAVTIHPPSAEERAERRAVHASLDAITKLLQSPKET